MGSGLTQTQTYRMKLLVCQVFSNNICVPLKKNEFLSIFGLNNDGVPTNRN